MVQGLYQRKGFGEWDLGATTDPGELLNQSRYPKPQRLRLGNHDGRTHPQPGKRWTHISTPRLRRRPQSSGEEAGVSIGEMSSLPVQDDSGGCRSYSPFSSSSQPFSYSHQPRLPVATHLLGREVQSQNRSGTGGSVTAGGETFSCRLRAGPGRHVT